MFPLLLIFYLLFTLGYGICIAAILYHVRRYTIPGHSIPNTLMWSFFILSGIFWIIGVIALRMTAS